MDLIYKKKDAKAKIEVAGGKQEKDEVIAIVEYKAPGLIYKGETGNVNFLEGLISAKERAAKLESLRGRQTAAQRESWLDNNAKTFLKQAAAYAYMNRTPYVALFSWKVMLLIEFDNMDFDAALDEATGDSAKATWFEENDDDEPGHTFRKLLLGMMEKAFIAKGFQPQ
ncbi:hypothetical protein K491DRAFT_601095 [Lophiostoma macrostomum CBS 122681]|uniref:Uncharacterized protein n=1 Tax=Lophiostoma macrostomum CBS 122681 TaxID=1314788 RepID=A0A6A6T602_9PLEO|nr:hypothetical protein K491DRAFT_601095 [Lophiostoma macrostomum CBS 122681]